MAPSTEVRYLLLEGATLLVALCLRRGAFRDHSTLESLLAGKEKVIRFKKELLDQPIFCRSTEGGWKVERKEPMKDHALRTKFAKVAEKAGMGGECSLGL